MSRFNNWQKHHLGYLGPNTLKILRAIMSARGQPPSLRDLIKVCEVKTTNGITRHLELLQRRGLISWDRHSPRTAVARVRFIPVILLDTKTTPE